MEYFKILMNIFIYKISKDDRKGEITMDKNAIDVLVIDDDGTISHSLESYLATREDIEHVDLSLIHISELGYEMLSHKGAIL